MGSIRVSRKALNKQNMIRIYNFSVIMSVAMLIATIVLGVSDFAFLNKSVQTPMLIIFIIFNLGFTLTSYVFRKKHLTSYYKSFIYMFWGSFLTLGVLATYVAEDSAKSIICYFFTMMALGFIPVMKTKRYLVFWCVQLVSMTGLFFVRSFSSEGIIALVSVNLMSILLNTTTYNSNIKNLAIKASLTDAIAQAETDPMTKLLNRRGLERRISNIWPHCVRQHTDIAVIMMDIDFFKKYNDSFGHAEGDECIKAVTSSILESVRRQTDYAARVGGEEFLVLLTGIEPKQALQWSLNLKQKIEDLRIPHSKDNFLPYVTVSMGLYCCQVSQDKTFEKAREEADKSLYDAKYNGRACLSFNRRIFAQITPYKYKKRRANG